MKQHYSLIGACSGYGAQINGCKKGPEKIVDKLNLEKFKESNIYIEDVEMLYPEKENSPKDNCLKDSIKLIEEFNLKLYNRVNKAIKKDLFPIVLGGDHSIGIGTWNAFQIPFGLLWIDAHMDSHTPETTPSGACHGMPLAALLGYGPPELSQLTQTSPILNPENIILIGIRSFEKEEAELLNQLNVKIYFMDEVKKRGLQVIMEEAIDSITQRVSHYGISLDLDVFTPEEAPGVGSPEPFGISKNEFLPLISSFSKDERFIGFEMVELNPERDIDNKTCQLALDILQEVLSSRSELFTDSEHLSISSTTV